MINDRFPFDPFFLFTSPLFQTLMGWLLNLPFNPASKTRIIELSDHDKLALEITTPEKWTSKDMTVILIHGLCGSHNSISLVRLTRKLEKKNIRAIRLNLRGCGSGKGLAKSTYHAGKCDDILEVLKIVKEETPDSPKVLIGFSMGGNMVLKLAGELGEEGVKYLDKVIAVSPPIDMGNSAKLFEKPENILYLKYFAHLLRSDIQYMKNNFPNFSAINLPRNITIEDFNRLFVVPFFGFSDVEEYYRSASAKYVIPKIKVPCKVILSKDDPIVSWQSFYGIEIPQNMDLYMTEKGGHIGYLGALKDERGFYWLDSILLDWILSNPDLK